MNLTSYNIFREFYQILDMILLNTNHLSYDPIGLVLCVMHTVLDRQFEQLDIFSFGSKSNMMPTKNIKNPTKVKERKKAPASPLMQYHREAQKRATPKKTPEKDDMLCSSEDD